MTPNQCATHRNATSLRPAKPGATRAARKKRKRLKLQIAYFAVAMMFLCAGIWMAAFILINPATAQWGQQFLASLPPGKTGSVSSAPPVRVRPLLSETQAPTTTATPTLSATPTATATPSATATPTPTETATLLPTETPTEQNTPTPLPTDTPEPVMPTAFPSAKSSTGSGGVKWIEVDLSDQMLYAWEGKTLVASFLVSTGAAPYRTITGSYPIYEKHRTANMWGPGYFFPDVPYTMYFYKGYGIHGTYWHNHFGTPMSHGCVNMSVADAQWLYNWAPIGTSVKVHQ